MTILDELSQRENWESFYTYRSSLTGRQKDLTQMRAFIDTELYLPVCEEVRCGRRFPLPRKAVLSKMSSLKKRTVYIYPRAENLVLKMLTYLLIRRYDAIFSKGLYSFRPGRTAKDALRALLAVPEKERRYFYKTDISDYFNSVPVESFLPVLENTLKDDLEAFRFLRRLLNEPAVIDRGKPVKERKGIMAGTPLAAFYANLYLADLDAAFCAERVPYARYSDDILLFGRTPEEAEERAERLKIALREKGLSINPAKEESGAAEDGWTFLGFFCRNGTVDVAPATVDKLKHKMRRKARALARWRDRNGKNGEFAAKAFIRIFNHKLLESAEDGDLNWADWFFSMITTDKSLREIDRYAQDCLRFLISGVRTKARYSARYEDLKRLGYRSLVHAYYAYRPGKETQQDTGS